MSIKAYKPNLQCDHPDAPVKRFGPTGPVQTILNQMKVSKWEQVFGKAGSPKVEVPLPITIPDGQCSSATEPSSESDLLTTVLASGRYFITVDIDGTSVSARWYDLWTDAVAVTGICVQNDKWGVSTRPSKLKIYF